MDGSDFIISSISNSPVSAEHSLLDSDPPSESTPNQQERVVLAQCDQGIDLVWMDRRFDVFTSVLLASEIP